MQQRRKTASVMTSPIAKSAYAIAKRLAYPAVPWPKDGLSFSNWLFPANAADSRNVPGSRMSCRHDLELLLRRDRAELLHRRVGAVVGDDPEDPLVGSLRRVGSRGVGGL